jgi:multiple antibiotic resistance protein
MTIQQLLENTIYFLALINPASKILFLSTKDPAYKRHELFSVSMRSSLVAWLILVLLTFSGNFVLSTIFHVEIYSLSVAGGIILFIIGLNAVRKGQFYEKNYATGESDLSIVPLAAPLIAGPGVMTAAISFASMHGIVMTLLCITLAVIFNLFFMLASLRIGRFLERVRAIGPIIRITGLIVTSVAMQMIFSGLTMWVDRNL